jgi:L-ascorbate metabolism protein UlaG (beta-lactamase superfamily)
MQRPAKADDAVTWIGHATLLFEHAGKTVLTDPMFSERASPVSFSGPKRVVPPARQLDGLPDIDLVVISHAHYDHLDMPTLRQLAALQPDITVIAPLGVGRYVREAGFTDVRELDWWQAAELPGMTVTATPSRHWSSRSFFDRNKTLWAGFMIRFADDFQSHRGL